MKRDTNGFTTYSSRPVWITDPDPGTGWTVPFSNGGVAGGFEIGDLCAYTPIEKSNLNGTVYNIQPEYSNLVHGCVNQNSGAP